MNYECNGTWKITLASFPSGDDAFEEHQLSAIMTLCTNFSCSTNTCKMFTDTGAIISREKNPNLSIQTSELNVQVNADALELERGFEGIFLLSFFFSLK